ncbi:hypothetical protein NIES267_73360 (plasmid) [Calothrix parasitica NIES-267]|uniref:Uncharacterized protein n=1 Tax=Calothrix parasitica NIES-267 TaxID=1973488 RepID=A0A1Z4M2W1_9CYAN|nr:hypothetical protein NIES267_73360 [Calothrix parasitica NIES-267]
MTDFLTYKFQTKIRKDSTTATLATFLKQKDGELSEREMVQWAIQAFWLPLAMKESGSYTQEEINRYGLAAIQRLQHQITYLCLVLNLELPSFSVLSASNVTEFDTPLPREKYLKSQAVKKTTTSAREPSEEVYASEEDEMCEEDSLDYSRKIALSTDTNPFENLE